MRLLDCQSSVRRFYICNGYFISAPYMDHIWLKKSHYKINYGMHFESSVIVWLTPGPTAPINMSPVIIEKTKVGGTKTLHWQTCCHGRTEHHCQGVNIYTYLESE